VKKSTILVEEPTLAYGARGGELTDRVRVIEIASEEDPETTMSLIYSMGGVVETTTGKVYPIHRVLWVEPI